MQKKKPAQKPARQTVDQKLWLVPLLTLAFFLMTSLTGGASMKSLARIMVVAAAISCLVRLAYVRERLSLPMMAVCLWVGMNFISTFYAVSGRFALIAFMNLVVGFAVFLLILAWSPRGGERGRFAASILSGGAALASLISIDMLSTHFLSDVWFAILEFFAAGNSGIGTAPIEVGVRMLSLYGNPNVFAGVAGLGVILALGLSVSAQEPGERRYHQVCLLLNALAFVLAFSMGASGMIALGFLALLIFERKERRGSLFLLMVETLLVTLLCVFPIYITAFGGWDGVQPIPLLCAAAGSAVLCLLDQFVGQRVSKALEGKGKALLITIAAALALLVGFVILALNLTGPADLTAGEGLSRAAYPAPGSYTLNVEATGPLSVTIESQDQQETMMHTSSVLYRGDAKGAGFTVPKDSQVVYFRFSAGEALTLNSAAYSGEGGAKELKLDYKLLPGFIANRLQGLFANQNAIQRTVFFADGMKLFRRSPIFGLGIGAFENAILGVQSFFYETKYAHNHYIETLVTTGVVGLILFLGMLGLCAAALWKNLRRKEDADPLAPALAAALVFMAGHAGVEVVFSLCYYLPMALGTLGLICLYCGQELPLPVKKEKTGSVIAAALAAPLLIFAVLLSLNISMEVMMDERNYVDGFSGLKQAATLDVFDSDSYKISYVLAAKDVDPEKNGKIRTQADKYAKELAKVDSNSIPIYLAQYYFSTERPEEAIAMLKKHVGYSAADSKAWRDAFGLLKGYYNDGPVFRQGVKDIYQSFQEWNENNIGTITLTDDDQQFVDLILSLE